MLYNALRSNYIFICEKIKKNITKKRKKIFFI